MTKNNIKGFWFNNYTWICSSIIVALFMFIFMYIFKLEPFGTRTLANGDCFHQMLPMLSTFQSMLKNGDNIFYYWNSSLGGDFLPTYFYYIAAPYYFLVYFIQRDNLSTFITITVIIKIILSTGFFGFYISRRNEKVSNSIFFIAISCCYGLSNYMCAYYYEIMWIDALVLFPIIMYGYDKMIKRNEPIVYVLSLGYSLYCNYYISYIVCLFLIIWFLIDEHKSFKNFIKNGIKFSLYSILAAGMAFISLYSSFVGLTKTVSFTESRVTHSWYGSFFEVIRQQYIVTNPIITSVKENNANIYCGTIVIITLFMYFLINSIDIKTKIKRGVLFVVLYVSMNEALLNYIWHGFHKQHGVPNRFAFLLIFLLLITAIDVYEHIKDLKIKYGFIALIIAEALPVIIYVFVDYSSILSSHQILAISSILTLIYSVGLIALSENKKIVTRVIGFVLPLIMIMEICCNALLVIKKEIANPIPENAIYSQIIEAQNIIESKEDSIFYRSDINDTTIDNANMFCGMKGIGAFNSTVNLDYVVFSQYMGDHTGKNRLMFAQSKNYLDSITGLKYIYAFEGFHDYDYDPNYQEVLNHNGVVVYKNNNALPLGYGVNKKIREFNYLQQDKLSENINYFVNCMTLGEDILSMVNPEYSLDVTGCEFGIGQTDYFSLQYDQSNNKNEDKRIAINFDIIEDGNYFIDIREDNEDYITLKVNGNTIKESIWLINGLNTLGPLKTGDNVEVEITDNKGVAYQENKSIAEVKVFVYKIDNNHVQEYVDKLSKNPFTIKQFSNSKFSGNITLDDDQLLMLSIPYDKGWHVYENGKELKTEKIANTFLGVDLGKGEHELSFVFIPQSLYVGILFTAIFWLIFLVVLIYHIKRYKSIENDDDDK